MEQDSGPLEIYEPQDPALGREGEPIDFKDEAIEAEMGANLTVVKAKEPHESTLNTASGLLGLLAIAGAIYVIRRRV